MSETEIWRELYPLRTALRRAIIAAETLRRMRFYTARRVLGAVVTAVTWARERGIIDEETTGYLQRLAGALIDSFDRWQPPDPRRVDYLADRILITICRVYASRVRREGGR